jgi:hypothetical protein
MRDAWPKPSGKMKRRMLVVYGKLEACHLQFAVIKITV